MLIERIERNALSAEDRRVLVQVLTFYFWLLFALREARLRLKRLKTLVFGEKSNGWRRIDPQVCVNLSEARVEVP